MKSSNRRRTGAAIDPLFSQAAIDQLAHVSAAPEDSAVVTALEVIVRCERQYRPESDAELANSDVPIYQTTVHLYRFARLLDAAAMAGYVDLTTWPDFERFRRLLRATPERDSKSLSNEKTQWLTGLFEPSASHGPVDVPDQNVESFYVFGAYLQLMRSVRGNGHFSWFEWYASRRWQGAGEFLQSPRHFAKALAGEGSTATHLIGGLEYIKCLTQLSQLLERLGDQSTIIDKMIVAAEWSHVADIARQQFSAWAEITATWEKGVLTSFLPWEIRTLRPTRSDLERLQLMGDSVKEDAAIEAERLGLFEAVAELRASAPRREMEAERAWLRARFDVASERQRMEISVRLAQLDDALTSEAVTGLRFPV